MAKHRSHSIEFKRQVAQEYLAGETLHGLAKRHDISRNLIRIWVAKYEAGAFDDDARGRRPPAGVRGADRRAGAPGRQAGARDRVSKGGSRNAPRPRSASYIRHHRPAGLSVAEGCRLMGLAALDLLRRARRQPIDDAEIVERDQGDLRRVRVLRLSAGRRRAAAQGIVVNPRRSAG